jgi:uncharacterized membrane protein HdeD (DUF308 family)
MKKQVIAARFLGVVLVIGGFAAIIAAISSSAHALVATLLVAGVSYIVLGVAFMSGFFKSKQGD